MKKKDLEEIFEKYGKIVDIVMKEKKEPYAFVEYEDIRDAEDAVERWTFIYEILWVWMSDFYEKQKIKWK